MWTTESIASILENESAGITAEWLARVSQDTSLMDIPLKDAERTEHMPQLIKDVIARLRSSQSADPKQEKLKTAQEHGRLRREQGYTAPLVVEESRALQASLFHTLRNNLFRIDCSLAVLDMMTIADELGEQLCQNLRAFTEDFPAMPGGNRGDLGYIHYVFRL